MKTSFPLIYNQYNGLLNTLSNEYIKVDYTFDVLDAVTNVVYRNGAGNTVASFDYKHDILGLITQKVTVVDGNTVTNSYTYDNLGRLTFETLTPSTPSNSPTPICYTYDLAGNRLSVGGSNFTYMHNKLNSVYHDAAGNITNMVRNGVVLDLTWNSQGQLISVDTNGVFAESYTWGPFGNRLSTTDASGTTYHAYDGSQCIADYNSSGDLLASYTWGSGIDNLLAVTVYEETSTNTYYAIKDHLNSIHALIDESGSTVMSVRYNAWGTPLNSSLSIQNSSFRLRYLFQGREYSGATGLCNFRARWYDSGIGRWLSKDPIGLEGGMNLYVFCGNNPVNYRDSDGLREYAAVTVSGTVGVGPFSVEGGSITTADIMTGETHGFSYAGGGVGFGLGGAGSVEVGVVNMASPDDFSGLGMAVSAFGAAGIHGASAQASRTVYFDVDAGALGAGGAVGGGAGISGGITYTWYLGEGNLADLPQNIRALLLPYLKEELGK